jgi:hypothetical protein
MYPFGYLTDLLNQLGIQTDGNQSLCFLFRQLAVNAVLVRFRLCSGSLLPSGRGASTRIDALKP